MMEQKQLENTKALGYGLLGGSTVLLMVSITMSAAGKGGKEFFLGGLGLLFVGIVTLGHAKRAQP
jgi:hypothetical protein